MELVHQIITVSLWISSLQQIEVYGCYKIFLNIKKIKSQHKIYMSGGIYQ